MLPSERPRTRTRNEIFDDCRKFLGQLDRDDNYLLVLTMLSSYEGTIDEFLNLRHSVWPDSEFYHPGFSKNRMQIALAMICQYQNTKAVPAMCRSVLGLDNGSAQDSLDFHMRDMFRRTLFHGLTAKIGTFNHCETAGEWHTLAHDVLKHLRDIRVLSHRTSMTYFREEEWQMLTPLLTLIQATISAVTSPYQPGVLIKATNSAAVLARCEKSIFA